MEKIYLKEVAQINVGISISKLKEKMELDGVEEKYISPRAMCNNFIKDDELEFVKIEKCNNYRRTMQDDIIIKTTAPFDCVFIDEKYQGMIYNSFCVNVRVNSKLIDNRYVYAFLNTQFIKNQFENKGKSYKTTPMSKKDIENIKIPNLKLEEQILIGRLYFNVLEREKTFNQMIINEKNVIDSIIARKGGF